MPECSALPVNGSSGGGISDVGRVGQAPAAALQTDVVSVG